MGPTPYSKEATLWLKSSPARQGIKPFPAPLKPAPLLWYNQRQQRWPGHSRGKGHIVLAVIITPLVGSVRQYRRSNASPVPTVEAAVSDKRTNVHVHTGGGHHHRGASGAADYCATLQVDSGSRIGLALSPQEYGQPAPGNRGKLIFQGTRYLGFERDRGAS